MAKAAGRKIVIAKGGTPIATATMQSIKWAGGGIDVTNRDSNGFREYLNGLDLEEQSITISVEGIESDGVLRNIALKTGQDKMLTDLTFKFADALAAEDTVSGNFLLVDFEHKGDHKGAAEFSATLESSGSWTVG